VSFSGDGMRVASAASDNTARIWDAHVTTDWRSQFLWELAFEPDPLTEVQRTQIGIPFNMTALANGALQTQQATSTAIAAKASEEIRCSRETAAYYDPDRVTPGIRQSDINADLARSACLSRALASASGGRILYLEGRAALASGDAKAARLHFESALAAGYRTAGLDLGVLLTDPSAQMLDPALGIPYLEKAWASGVLAAGFQLGVLYEHGILAGAGGSNLRPDMSKAWQWYELAAAREEPHSLARLAERTEREALEKPGADGNLLLQAFKLYALAEMHARSQQWPDRVSKTWRYRRSTLARVLDFDGHLQQVADVYDGLLRSQRQ